MKLKKVSSGPMVKRLSSLSLLSFIFPLQYFLLIISTHSSKERDLFISDSLFLISYNILFSRRDNMAIFIPVGRAPSLWN